MSVGKDGEPIFMEGVCLRCCNRSSKGAIRWCRGTVVITMFAKELQSLSKDWNTSSASIVQRWPSLCAFVIVDYTLLARVWKKGKPNNAESEVQSNWKYKPVTVEEMELAEQYIVKLVRKQALNFSKELSLLKQEKADQMCLRFEKKKRTMSKSSTLVRLDNFIDENGLMRVGKGKEEKKMQAFKTRWNAQSYYQRKHHCSLCETPD